MLLDLGLFILRLMLGLTFMGHGSQKLFGWFKGGGWKGTQKMVAGMGSRPVWFWALLSGLSEFGGGLLLVLGLLSPIGSLGIIAAMSIAVFKVHWRSGFWVTNHGIEYPLTNLVAALTLALAGPGHFSLDALFGLALPEPLALVIGLVLVAIGLFAQDLSKKSSPAQPSSAGQGNRP